MLTNPSIGSGSVPDLTTLTYANTRSSTNDCLMLDKKSGVGDYSTFKYSSTKSTRL